MSSLSEEICFQVPFENLNDVMYYYKFFFYRTYDNYSSKQLGCKSSLKRIQKYVQNMKQLKDMYKLLHKHQDYWEFMVRSSYLDNFDKKFEEKWPNCEGRQFKVYLKVFLAFVRKYYLINEGEDWNSYYSKLLDQTEIPPGDIFPPEQIEDREHLELVIKELNEQRLKHQKTKGFSTKQLFPTFFKLLSFGYQVCECVFDQKQDVRKTIKKLLQQSQKYNRKTSMTFKNILTVSKEFEAFMICLTYLIDFEKIVQNTFQGSKDSEDLKAALQYCQVCVEMIRRSNLIKPGKIWVETKNKIQKQKSDGIDPQYPYALFENETFIAIIQHPIQNLYQTQLWEKDLIKSKAKEVYQFKQNRYNIQDRSLFIEEESNSKENIASMTVEEPVPDKGYELPSMNTENDQKKKVQQNLQAANTAASTNDLQENNEDSMQRFLESAVGSYFNFDNTKIERMDLEKSVGFHYSW